MDLAVILAGAGEGRRMGTGGPKLLLEIGGRSVLARVAATFLSLPEVGELVAVVPQGLLSRAEGALRTLGAAPRAAVRVIAGGATRQESVALGLASLARGLPWVAVHDAARPLVSAALIRRVLEAARASGAAIPAIPVRDTVKEVIAGRVARTVSRERLEAAQTPQIFARDILERAHHRARASGAAATDDASLAEAIGAPVAVVAGEPSNLKLTEPSDVILMEAWLRSAAGTAS